MYVSGSLSPSFGRRRLLVFLNAHSFFFECPLEEAGVQNSTQFLVIFFVKCIGKK